MRTYQVSGFDAVLELLIIDIGQRLEAFRTQVSAVRSSEYRVATHFLGEFRDGLLLQLAVILLLVLCGGIWMSMLSATAIRGILMPVRGMIDHVNRIAVDDAVPDLPVLRRDEIGTLAVHINAMTQSVREANAARETARAALAAERQNLVDAVEALNEGFAAFDANELLIQSNQKYREIYPEISAIAVHGVSLTALLNLAVNARDAMPNGGTLTITAANETVSDTRGGPESLSGDCVVITVADTGTGMPAEIVTRAFEPFFTTKSFGKGSGLGLRMVYGFVRQSGGSISIESLPGQGTSIHIYLPRAPLEAELGDETAEGGMIITGSGSTIPVVEDNEALRLAVVRQLRELGYEVVEADSARPALRILASDATVDLLLTDIVMPGGMDGRALAHAALKLRPTLPIIFTSGFPAGGGDIPVSGMQEIGVAVLAKPVRGAELAQHIRHALETQSIAALA